MLKLLEKLCVAPGISGHEERVRDLILEEIKPYVDEWYVDNMGNLITTKWATGLRWFSAPKIMLAAHMDEIGLVVKYIDDKGFIYFNKIGGWFDQTLLNQRMIVHTDKAQYWGIIGCKPPHVMKASEYDKVIKLEDMFIDVGATSKAEVRRMSINVGDQIVPDSTFCTLRNDIIAGKAFDNRAGCVMLIEAMKQLKNPNITVHAVFTVQEEVGLKGAKTSAFRLNPDFAFATDVTICGDHPGINTKDANVVIGKGPAITIHDASGRGIIVPKIILDKVKRTSRVCSIPIQLECGDGGTTDGTAIHLTREGIPTGVISVPTRYIHTPYSVISAKDLRLSISLLANILNGW